MPLMWAASKGHTEVARLLIEAGAEVNAKDRIDATALTWAAFNGHSALRHHRVDVGEDSGTARPIK